MLQKATSKQGKARMAEHFWRVEENIFANHISNKGLVSRRYKELLQLNNEKTPISNYIQNIWIDFFQRWSKSSQQAHENILNIISHQGNANPIQQSDIPSHPLEWLSPKRQVTGVQLKEMEKSEPSFSVGGHANWCSPCGKQSGSYSKS